MEAITSVIILILMKTLNIKAAALSTKFFYHRRQLSEELSWYLQSALQGLRIKAELKLQYLIFPPASVFAAWCGSRGAEKVRSCMLLAERDRELMKVVAVQREAALETHSNTKTWQDCEASSLVFSRFNINVHWYTQLIRHLLPTFAFKILDSIWDV